MMALRATYRSWDDHKKALTLDTWIGVHGTHRHLHGLHRQLHPCAVRVTLNSQINQEAKAGQEMLVVLEKGLTTHSASARWSGGDKLC